MEKNFVFWGIGIVLALALVFNLSSPTANVAKSGAPLTKEPVLKVLNPNIAAGSNLKIKVDNIRSLTSSRLNIFYTDETYSGVSFPIGRGDCKFASGGYYNCETAYNIPHSLLPDGRYYLQVKSDSLGEVTGNKAFFTISNSQYQETGR
ncbi:hypothetical protein HYV89_01540 [Candidatus Woesearchaeota archaeon]|nr:hypothetical protein [Candidatus Woesearchaeota archaeon]